MAGPKGREMVSVFSRPTTDNPAIHITPAIRFEEILALCGPEGKCLITEWDSEAAA